MATEEPDSSPPQKPRDRPAAGARQISDVLELPFMLVGCVAIGGGLGYFLDARFHTSPILTLVLGVIGFAAGMILLVKRLSKDTKGNGGA